MSRRPVRRWMGLLAAAILPSCGGGGGGGGPVSPWQGAVLIETDAGAALEPDLAVDENGGAVAVWRQFGSTVATPLAHYIAYANRYAGAWGGRVQLNDTANDSMSPSIALDAAGNGLAAWLEENSDDVEARRYDVGSGTWIFLAPLDPGSDVNLPSRTAFAPNGNAIVVFQSFDAVRWSVMANVYTAGVGFAGAVDIDGSSATAQGPQVDFDGAGHAMVVWQQNVGADVHILSKRHVDGVGWGAVLPVDNSAGTSSGPQVAVDAAGNAVAVWHKSGAVGNDIWASRYDVVGDAWSAPALLETDDTAGALNPRIACNAAGQAMAVWRQSDGTRFNGIANRYVPGVGWQGPAPIEGDAGTAGNPSVAMDADGNAVAVWAQFDGVVDSVYANRFTPAGGWGGAGLIESMPGNAVATKVALDSNGDGFAVWNQGDDIWVNRFQR